MHKRWKLTTLKKILVLSDGKKGHLNQSLAVVKQIRQYRQEEGYSPDQLKVNVTEIHFKNRFYRTFFNLATPFMNRFLQGRPGFLKMVLQSGSHENIIRQYADVIVSCGSALVGVNKALKIENNARNVTVLDPGLRNRSSFDLIVMPRHDITGVKGQGSRVRDNVVMTELAPNLIDKKELDTMRQGARRRGHDVRGVPKHPCFGGKGQECPCIGLLFGGDNPYFHFSEKITRSVADNIKKVCKDLGGISYVTTSRRTSDMSEKILKDMFSDDVTCREFVSGKEDKDPNTVRKILTGSDVIIVSGESISMVSEAVASGRSVLVFMPEKKKKSITKYERFAGNLEKREYLRLADPADIGNAVKEVLKDGRNPEIPDDNIKIRSKLYKLF